MIDLPTLLRQTLADYTVLYQKLRAYHWTVVGPDFFTLHVKFEELYMETATAIDDVAERILAREGVPLTTYKAILAASEIEEAADQVSPKQMVSTLAEDYTTLIATLRKAIEAAESADDRTTVNLLDGLADAHAKTVWMLKAYLGG